MKHPSWLLHRTVRPKPTNTYVREPKKGCGIPIPLLGLQVDMILVVRLFASSDLERLFGWVVQILVTVT
jgi:hypothetical protein